MTVVFARQLSSSNNPSDLSKCGGDSDEPSSRCYRVTAMLLQSPPHCVLWVGLASGHMILFNATTRSPVLVIQRHHSDIRTIVDIRAKGEGGREGMGCSAVVQPCTTKHTQHTHGVVSSCDFHKDELALCDIINW